MITKDKTTITYKGDGVTTSFPFPYQYRAGEDIRGYLLVNGKEMPIVANYRFDEVENKFIYPVNGVPLFATDTLVIKRETPIEQNADLPNKYPYNAVETVADNLTLIVQEQEAKIKGIENIRDELNEITERTISMNFPNIKDMLDARAINADSDSLEDILRAIVKEVVPDGDYSNHLAEFTLVNEKVEVGSTTVEIIGQPHFFITEQDHRDLQQIPAGGRLAFTLSSPFNGEEKTLDILYPDVSKGVYNQIIIPQNTAEQVIQDDTQGATGAKLYLNSQGHVCISTRTYETLADVFKWSYLAGRARQHDAPLTIDCYERGTAIKADGLTALSQHFQNVNCITEWPSHVDMPSQSGRLSMNLNIARSKGDTDLVQNDLSGFECRGQRLNVTDGRLEYVEL
jgi:hypothetical protein